MKTINVNPTQGHRLRVPWPGVLLCLLLLLLPFPPPPREGWLPFLWNFAHAPLFAWMGWSFLRVVRSHNKGWPLSITSTATGALALALGTEALQYWTGRTPDWGDVMTDFLGAAAGMSVAGAMEMRGRKITSFCCLILLGTGLMMTCASPLMQRALVLARKQAAFPLLEDFEHKRNLSLWFLEQDGKNVDLTLITESIRANHFNQRLLVTVPSTGVTSLHYDAQRGDWSHASRLVFEYTLESSGPLVLGVRLDSSNKQKRRLRLQTTLLPGRHQAEVNLPSDNASKATLESVGQLVLFSQDVGIPATLALNDLLLD